ncbi:MAG: SpoIIIAC/SpoIIIAD family protein [Oscillospiraceae bacterium]
MDIFLVIIFSITSCVLAMFIKQYNVEVSLLITIITGVLIFSYILVNVSPVFDRLSYIFYLTGEDSGNLSLLVKGLGICFITQLTCDICEDSGQKAISTKVEMAGKFSILILALPLFTELIFIISSIING